MKKKILILMGLIITAAAVITVLEITNTTHIFHTSAVVRAPSKPITILPASKSATEQTTNSASNTSSSTSSANSSQADTQTSTDGVNQGNDTDKNGQVPSSVTSDKSQWSTSTSGLITVKSPTENSTFSTGGTLAGSADSSIKQVQYTLIDDQYGVISQGLVNVVNGNFAAQVNFSSHSSSGRLDVFNTDSNGKEINEVQVDVNF